MLKKIFMYFMGVVYILAGINHFWHPDFYMKMVETFLPYPLTMIYISGIAEMAGGLGLMIPATRRLAAFGLVFLLIAIFPTNLYMAIAHDKFPEFSSWALYGRLPMQLVLIYLANIYTKTSQAFYGERTKEQPIQ
jgi:uncharacterized membrane protein